MKVGIAGGSGYGGVELIGILLGHPEVELTSISSGRNVGLHLSDLYPHLKGYLDLPFSSLEETVEKEVDVLFLALPHGEAMEIVPRLETDPIVIDLSGDFRIEDRAIFERYYKRPQTAPEIQSSFVYGLPEVNREEIRGARRIANPGCFATATILALFPLYEEDLIDGPVYVDAKTGSSGSGRTPSPGTHHPRRSHSLFPYKPFAHQHLPEIRQVLSNADHPLVFQTHSTPLVRGIFSSHYMRLQDGVSESRIEEVFRQYYSKETFIRLVRGGPDSSAVEHSNLVDIGWACDSEFLIVWSALDNLQKGAAGQAVQNMNITLDLEETTALEAPPRFP